MLLLDDNNQAFSESENPLIGGRNLKAKGASEGATKKGNTTGQEKLLSEIAEQDDVSSVSENQANKMAGVYN